MEARIQVVNLPSKEITAERELRIRLWEEIGRDDRSNVQPRLLRERGIYGGAQGIWVDKSRTVALSENGQGVTVAFSTYQPFIAIVLWPGSSLVALLSRILTERFFRIRAESFGPLVERVFQCAGDDGCGAG